MHFYHSCGSRDLSLGLVFQSLVLGLLVVFLVTKLVLVYEDERCRSRSTQLFRYWSV